MAYVVLHVELPDDDPFVQHYGWASQVEDYAEALTGSHSGTEVKVLDQQGPPGHACGVCGGAMHDGACRPGSPPDDADYLTCCGVG